MGVGNGSIRKIPEVIDNVHHVDCNDGFTVMYAQPIKLYALCAVCCISIIP